MRLTRQKAELEQLELEMAPMIDVVFLLLIFFMCTSSFKKPELEIATGLPVAKVSTKVRADDFEPILIAVGIKRGAGLVITVNGYSCRDYTALENRLLQLRELYDSPVTIDAIGSVPWDTMVKTFDAGKRANFSRVAFAATTRIRLGGG